MTERRRFDGIDLLRGVSIIGVVLLHIALRMQFSDHSLWPLMPRWFYHLVFQNGNNGVTVFFAVSGFLITLTSLQRFGSLGQMRIGAFYRIRFARIAPLLILVVAILSALHLANVQGFHIRPERGSLPRAILAAFTFHLNWLEAARGYLPPNWDVLWSLSVEEMFYLFFPIVCWTVERRSRRAFLTLLIAFVVMGPFARSVWTAGNPIWREKSYLGGMDAIALGCLAALLTNRLRGRVFLAPWLSSSFKALGAVLLFWIALWPAWPLMRFIGAWGLDGTVLALGACCVMVPAVLSGEEGSRWTAPVRWFGRNSYEVYMTHEFVLMVFALATADYNKSILSLSTAQSIPFWCGLMFLLSAPLGALTTRYYSEPLNRLLRPRLQPRPVAAEAPAAVS